MKPFYGGPEGIQQHMEEQERMRLAVAQEGDLFRIKPLEWDWLTTNGVGFWNSDAPVGGLSWRLYQIEDEWRLNPSGKSSIQCTSPEEGKQLAESHWREYIKQALVPIEAQQQ